MIDDEGHVVRYCAVGKQHVELAPLNLASTALGGFVKRAHFINSSVVGSRISGNRLARAIPRPASDNMFGRNLGQGKIGVVRRVQTPASDFVPTFDETANVIVKCTISAAARQIVPDCDFHLSTPICL